MHYHKHKMHEKNPQKHQDKERNTLHWPCVPDVQSDVTNAIGFMYIYSYVDIGDRKARSYFHVMFSLFVCTHFPSLLFCSYTSVLCE